MLPNFSGTLNNDYIDRFPKSSSLTKEKDMEKNYYTD